MLKTLRFKSSILFRTNTWNFTNNSFLEREVVATSQLGLIWVGTSRTKLRHHRDVTTGS